MSAVNSGGDGQAPIAPLEYSSDESVQYRPSIPGSKDAAVVSSQGHLMSPSATPSRASGKIVHGWMLPGEDLLVTEHYVGYLYAMGKTIGTLYVTNYRLYFESKETGDKATPLQFSVPLGFVSRVEKIGHSTVSRGEDSYGLEITCKDIRSLRFSSRQANHSRRPVFEKLQQFAFPVTHGQQFFAFSYKETFQTNGWTVYDPIREYSRMGIPNDSWRISKINQDYQFADTYPALLCVPKEAADPKNEEFLRAVGSFRSKARIPVLSWIHPESQASLTRCSQPLVGMTGRRSSEDERYLAIIIEANAQSPKLYIMDARPEVNAKVNKAKGGGYESEEAYPGAELVFLDIQNIHVMRESLRKLRDICFPRIDEKNWFTALEDTHWLDHIKLVLYGAMRVAEKIESQKTSVLVHCSDGWDRTAQVTSLAMIMLDGYYRTIEGLEVLIEKEWCSFGHKLAHRVGHGEEKYNDTERSPIFLQFMECIWQMIRQFPIAFEYNSRFLIETLDELYACRCGTFLYNTEQQRVNAKLRETTKSVWSVLAADIEKYTNPLYNPRTRNQVLMPNCSIRCLRLWKEYYLRHNVFVTLPNQEEEERIIREMLEVRRALQTELQRLLEEQSAAAQRAASASAPGNSNNNPHSALLSATTQSTLV